MKTKIHSHEHPNIRTSEMRTFEILNSIILMFTCSIVVFLSMCHLHAQDTALPSGNSRIHLYSGKTIKHIRLWRIDTAKVEYVENGNLMDIKTAEVKKIETQKYLILFDENYKMCVKNYDLILPYYGDSIFCFIQNADGAVISYIPVGSETKKSIVKSNVKFYMQWPEQKQKEPVISYQSSVTSDTSSISHQPSSIVITDSINKEKKTIPSETNQADYYVSQKKAEKEAADWKYYHQSYQRGVNDASRKPDGGWGVGGFCLGTTGCFPILSLSVVNSNVSVKTPQGVDKGLYEEGYKNQIKQQRVKAASTGALAALGVAAFIMMIFVSSNQ